MIVRHGTLDDVSTLVLWGARFFAESAYCKYSSYDLQKVGRQVRHMVDDVGSAVLMIDNVGMIGGGLISPYYTDEIVIAQEMWWYVIPEARRSEAGGQLVVEFCKWAKENGATHAGLTTNKNTHPNIHDFILSIGLEEVETSYIGAF